MRKHSWRWAAVAATIIGSGVSGTVVRAASTALPTPTAGCRSRIAIIGGNTLPSNRFAVLQALQVGPHTAQVTETYADQVREAKGLIPPTLLTRMAVSSSVLQPRPIPGGLSVAINGGITLDTPQTYANALLTAGIAHAAVTVAAPVGQPALGTTALLSLLRAATLTCIPVTPARRALAIQEVVLTSQLARYQALTRVASAPRFMTMFKGSATTRHITGTAALDALISRDAVASGVVAPAVLRPALVGFARSLVANGGYAPFASGATIRMVDPFHVTVTFKAGAAQDVTLSNGHTIGGTIVAVHGATLTVREASGVHPYTVAKGATVARAGTTVLASALRPGDHVTLDLDAAGLVRGGQVTIAPPVFKGLIGAKSASGGWAPGTFATLAALIILFMLLIPLLMLARRKKETKMKATI